MPELPEVETIRAGLAEHLVAATITRVHVDEPRSMRRHGAGVDDFVREVTGRTVVALSRRGKFLWGVLDDGRCLAVHLGMSGQLRLDEAGAAPLRHSRVRLEVECEGSAAVVTFADQRIFGWMALDALVPTSDGCAASTMGTASGSVQELIPAVCAHIARDPLDSCFDDAAVIATIRGRRAPIKSLLLDQGLISGVGNIYADEALWASGIRFDTPGREVPVKRLALLLDEVRTVFGRALAAGGTSFDALYVNVNGESGYFSRTLNVYGRAGEPCRRCGTSIVRVAYANRSSFYCPRCQRRR